MLEGQTCRVLALSEPPVEHTRPGLAAAIKIILSRGTDGIGCPTGDGSHWLSGRDRGQRTAGYSWDGALRPRAWEKRNGKAINAKGSTVSLARGLSRSGRALLGRLEESTFGDTNGALGRDDVNGRAFLGRQEPSCRDFAGDRATHGNHEASPLRATDDPCNVAGTDGFVAAVPEQCLRRRNDSLVAFLGIGCSPPRRAPLAQRNLGVGNSVPCTVALCFHRAPGCHELVDQFLPQRFWDGGVRGPPSAPVHDDIAPVLRAGWWLFNQGGSPPRLCRLPPTGCLGVRGFWLMEAGVKRSRGYA